MKRKTGVRTIRLFGGLIIAYGAVSALFSLLQWHNSPILAIVNPIDFFIFNGRHRFQESQAFI